MLAVAAVVHTFLEQVAQAVAVLVVLMQHQLQLLEQLT
jgi:hypothetical protein